MLVNATIQVVPLTDIEKAISVIDKAIAIIQQSGIQYAVGAFETTVEGEYQQVQALLCQIEDFCYSQADVEFLLYKKMHVCGGRNITAAQKTAKFEQR